MRGAQTEREVVDGGGEDIFHVLPVGLLLGDELRALPNADAFELLERTVLLPLLPPRLPLERLEVREETAQGQLKLRRLVLADFVLHDLPERFARALLGYGSFRQPLAGEEARVHPVYDEADAEGA
eukprot:762476-Hanusia_phi.AAC.4